MAHVEWRPPHSSFKFLNDDIDMLWYSYGYITNIFPYARHTSQILHLNKSSQIFFSFSLSLPPLPFLSLSLSFTSFHDCFEYFIKFSIFTHLKSFILHFVFLISFFFCFFKFYFTLPVWFFSHKTTTTTKDYKIVARKESKKNKFNNKKIFNFKLIILFLFWIS